MRAKGLEQCLAHGEHFSGACFIIIVVIEKSRFEPKRAWLPTTGSLPPRAPAVPPRCVTLPGPLPEHRF